uniref:PX domain-containing protein n=1 Tax=Kalanchoe fedtschenkoi TaxID=63787 RepID=A0A7N0RIF4_KALFE
MMMEVQGEDPLSASREDMESLVLDEPTSYSSPSAKLNGHSAAGIHPLSHPLASRDLDLLLSPSSQNPNFDSVDSYLDSPFDADAVVKSIDSPNGDTNGHWSPKPVSGSSEYIMISVSDPLKEQQEVSSSLVPGGNYYYTYMITTRTNATDFGGSEFRVRRRFKDVVTLADRLAESYRGYFIPLRPDKNVMESQVMQKQDFVEQRRVALEKYLRKLAEHPAIRKSDELRVFLQVQGKLPLPKTTDVTSRVLDGAVKLPKQLFGESYNGAVDISEVTQPAKGGRDLFRMFRELKQSVANDWGGPKPFVDEEDKEFLEKKQKLRDFEHLLADVSNQAEILVKAQLEIGETMGELGLSFIKLTKFETDQAMHDSQRVRAGFMKNGSTATVKASRLYRDLNGQTMKHLDKLHDYLGVMVAANSAFSDRSSALLTVQTLSTDLSSLYTKIEKLEAASSKVFGGDRSRSRKIEELKETARITEDAKSCAVREYERIKVNNKNELQRLDKEIQDDFLNMLEGYVANQAGYAEKMSAVWEKVAENLQEYAKESS